MGEVEEVVVLYGQDDLLQYVLCAIALVVDKPSPLVNEILSAIDIRLRLHHLLLIQVLRFHLFHLILLALQLKT